MDVSLKILCQLSNLLQVLGWAQAMPKFANDLVKYVQTFLERTYERCRTSYMEVFFFFLFWIKKTSNNLNKTENIINSIIRK